VTQFVNRGLPEVRPFTVNDFYRALEAMSTCPSRIALQDEEHQALALAITMEALHACWREEVGCVEDLSDEMEALLNETQVRRELAEVLFEFGEPTLSRLQMTCAWFFRVALTMHNANQKMTEKLHAKQATHQMACV
jgi:hypothetical protein